MTDDNNFMKIAIAEAKKALEADEIPVGAVLVRNCEVVGKGSNARLAQNSPLAHAELIALNDAAKTLGNWRFDGCTLYVTLEPCTMCAGAIVQCRVAKLVYGARDPKAGAAGSLYDIPSDPRMYHRCETVRDVMKEECAELLSVFFAKKRMKYDTY